MQTAWYQQTDKAVCAFFDVDPNFGLTQKEALKRLTHFGKNSDTTLPAGIEKELQVSVLRNQKKEYIPFFQVVPGDIVHLNPGDRVPADTRLIRVESLQVNQSRITGEPSDVQKNTYALSQEAPAAEQKCMVFAGSYITGGTGYGVVVERGNKTELGRSIRKRRHTRSLKGSVIARRLRRYGVLVLRKPSLAQFRRITHVIIDDNLSDTDIADIIRKVQLTRKIHCRFVVSEIQAKRLAPEMHAEVYDASSHKGTIETALFITNLHTDTDNSLHIVKSLEAKNRVIMWVTNGVSTSLAMKVAAISLVVGRLSRPDVTLAADLFASRFNSSILTRILYNKK